MQAVGFPSGRRVSSLWDDVGAALPECLVYGLWESFQSGDSLILPMHWSKKGESTPRAVMGRRKREVMSRETRPPQRKLLLIYFLVFVCLFLNPGNSSF